MDDFAEIMNANCYFIEKDIHRMVKLIQAYETWMLNEEKEA